jgi:hypothetical protein
MAGRKPIRVLYWIDGISPLPGDRIAADKIVGTVMFRNAQHVPVDGALEDFDDLAGPAIPARYAAELTKRSETMTADLQLVADLPLADVKAIAGPDAETGSNQKPAPEAGWGAPKV